MNVNTMTDARPSKTRSSRRKEAPIYLESKPPYVGCYKVLKRLRTRRVLFGAFFYLWFLITDPTNAFGATSENFSLAGQWRFALDRKDVGLSEQWYNRDLSDKIQLPGVLQSQGYGDEISTNTPWVLSLYDKNWFLRE